LLFEKYGHTEAYEKSKQLAHEALEGGLPLADVIVKDREASSYWKKFSKKQKNIILQPDLYYSGIAAQKALHIANTWTAKLK
jgi:hypothetical protein